MTKLRSALLILSGFGFSSAALHAQLLNSGPSPSNIMQVGKSNITLGAKPSASSFPVVFASDQATLPVSIAGNQAANITQIGGSALNLGQTTMSASLPVTIASNQTTLPVSLVGTSPVNLSQVGGAALALGQTTMSASVPVTIASNQTTLFTAARTVCGNTPFGQAWGAAPIATATITATTTCVNAITATNTSANDISLTVTDGSATPNSLIAGYIVPSNSTAVFPMYDTAATSGLKVVASAAGLNYAISGLQ